MAVRDFFASLFGSGDDEEKEQRDDNGLTFVQPDLPRNILKAAPEPVTWDDYLEASGKAFHEGGLVGALGLPLTLVHEELSELREAAQRYTAPVETEERQPWIERYLSRGDGSLTDTTTGEIIERPEPVWEPLDTPEPPEPSVYVESAEASEDGLTGEIRLGYRDDGAKEGDVFWDIFGTSVKDDDAGDDQDDNTGDDQDDDDKDDGWRII